MSRGLRHCSSPDCRQYAVGNLGVCKRHYERGLPANNTTDGLITGRKRKLTAKQIAEARQMRSAFKSMEEISRQFGISRKTLRSYLKKAPS